FNVGRDALELVVLSNPGEAPLDVYLAIERFMLPGFDGPDAGHMKIIDFGTRIAREWDTGGAGTSFGHANARGAIAVGAAAWFATPRFGGSPPRVGTVAAGAGWARPPGARPRASGCPRRGSRRSRRRAACRSCSTARARACPRP